MELIINIQGLLVAIGIAFVLDQAVMAGVWIYIWKSFDFEDQSLFEYIMDSVKSCRFMTVLGTIANIVITIPMLGMYLYTVLYIIGQSL